MSALSPSPVAGEGVVARTAVAAITMGRNGGGIAYASRLIARAMDESGKGGMAIVVDPRRYMTTSRVEQACFAARVIASQVSGAAQSIVYTHHHLAVVHCAAPRRWRRPYAVILHDRGAWDPGMSSRRVAAIKEACVRIAISHRTARLVLAAHPDVGPIHVCHLGLLPDSLSGDGELDDRLLRTLGRQVVLIVGRMWQADRHKGHDELLECWPSVLAILPNAQLVVVGDGDDRHRLESKATATGVGESVTFTGFVSDATLHEMLRRSAVFAMPSRDEGFGLVYLEAMRAGIACIAGTDDAAREVVVDGETGLLVQPRDRAALVGAIVRVLREDKLRATLGRAGQARYESHFTFAKFRHRIVQGLTPLHLAASKGTARPGGV